MNAISRQIQGRIQGNGKPFPGGRMKVKIEWEKEEGRTRVPYSVARARHSEKDFLIQKDSRRCPDSSGGGDTTSFCMTRTLLVQAFGEELSQARKSCTSAIRLPGGDHHPPREFHQLTPEVNCAHVITHNQQRKSLWLLIRDSTVNSTCSNPTKQMHPKDIKHGEPIQKIYTAREDW